MQEIRLELDEAKLNAIIMELDILHRAVAPEIVEFYGAFFIESCVYYCMEVRLAYPSSLSFIHHCRFHRTPHRSTWTQDHWTNFSAQASQKTS